MGFVVRDSWQNGYSAARDDCIRCLALIRFIHRHAAVVCSVIISYVASRLCEFGGKDLGYLVHGALSVVNDKLNRMQRFGGSLFLNIESSTSMWIVKDAL